MFEANLVGRKKALSKSLLIHFEGDDGSTSFKDEGGRSLKLIGSPLIKTTQKKFGLSSGFFSSAAGIDLPNPIDLFADYTVEVWLYLVSFPTGRGGIVQTKGVSNGSPLLFMPPGYIGLWINGVGSGSTWAAGGMTTGKWMHLAATRQGGIYRLFVDGVVKYTSPVSPVTPMSVNNFFQYQINPGEAGMVGYVDEFHINPEVALYTANFTPPTTPFTI